MLKRTYTDLGLLFLRVTAGLTMLFGHGLGKLDRLINPGDEPISFPDPFGVGDVFSLGLATFAEVVCAGLLALGLFTRWALIPLIITMGVAFFDIHIDDEYRIQEKSILFGVMYVVLWLTGPGKYSLDRMFKR